YRRIPQRSRIRAMVLFLLFVCWSNCHSGFVFGLFVLSVWECAEWAHRRVSAVSAGVTIAIAAGGALINPNTWHVYRYPFLFLVHSELFGQVSELRPLTTPAFQGGWFIPLFYTLMIVSLAVSLLRIRAGGWRETILVAVFSGLAIRAVRNVPLAILVMLPCLFLHGPVLVQRLRSDRLPSWVRTSAGLMAFGMPIFLIATALGAGIPIDRESRRTVGLGISELMYPRGAVRYIRNHEIQGNMFNTFAFGGFLLWELFPDPRVFIDGRLFVYMNGVLHDYREVIAGRMDLDQLNRKYGVTWFVLAYPEAGVTVDESLYGALKSRKDWVPVYWDDNAMLFVRDDGKNSAVIAEDGFRIIHPLHRTMTEIDGLIRKNPEGVLHEAERAVGMNPENSGAEVILGRYYSLKGQPAKSLEHYSRVLNRHPDNIQIRRHAAIDLLAAGRLQDAEKEWRRICAESRPDGFALMNLGVSLHRQGRLDDAEAWYRRSEQAGYRSPELFNALGIMHAQRGNMTDAILCWTKGLSLDPDHVQIRRNLERARGKRLPEIAP
ncbi:tetratricopeptide repeat protein, partial [bacterium]|nr:tetratricopeptide repeat protein [candidate division CSSED10-310 bacterium]